MSRRPGPADYPAGARVFFCGAWATVVATLPVEDGQGPCPFMVLLQHRPDEPPHPGDWVPVTSIERAMAQAGLPLPRAGETLAPCPSPGTGVARACARDSAGVGADPITSHGGTSKLVLMGGDRVRTERTLRQEVLMAKQSTTTAAASAPAPTTFSVTLDKVHVQPDFNHRVDAETDPAKYELTLASMRQHGQLQPVLVVPREDQDGHYWLLAGHKRLRAARELKLAGVDVTVRDETDRAAWLALSLLENITHGGLSPLEEARSYRSMIEAGATVRQIVRRMRPLSQARIRGRLQLLDLPEQLQAMVGTGEIPLMAVPVLVEIARVDPALALAAADAVLTEDDFSAPWTWSDLRDQREEVLDSLDADLLPEHVISSRQAVRFSRLRLDADGDAALDELAQLAGLEPDVYRERYWIHLTEEDLAYAERLGARYGSWVIGTDTIAALTNERLRTRLHTAREQDAAEREREAAIARAQTAATTPTTSRASASPSSTSASEPTADEKARALASALAGLEHDLSRRPVPELNDILAAFRATHGHWSVPTRVLNVATRRQCDWAAAFNDRLGHAVLSRMAKVRVDERVLKVLSAFDLHGDLEQIASRGARYCLPQCRSSRTTTTGRTKVTYVDDGDAARAAREFLAGATSLGELAGRQLALIVMAHLADQNAVAQSYRTFDEPGRLLKHHQVRVDPESLYEDCGAPRRGVPWAEEVDPLLIELATERLPQEIVARPLAYYKDLAAKREQKAANIARHAELEAAFDASIPDYDDADKLDKALDDFYENHDQLTPSIRHRAVERIRQLEAAAAAQAASEPAPSDEPGAAEPAVTETTVAAVDAGEDLADHDDASDSAGEPVEERELVAA